MERPTVLIRVDGGIASIAFAPEDLNIVIVDFDAVEGDKEESEGLITQLRACDDLPPSLVDEFTGYLRND